MSAVSIYAEASPNPESMKFVLNSTFLADGVSVDYPNIEAAVRLACLRARLALKGVKTDLQ